MHSNSEEMVSVCVSFQGDWWVKHKNETSVDI